MVERRRAIYDALADRWWADPSPFAWKGERIDALLADFDRRLLHGSGLEVLDLGCGGGYLSERLARRGCHVRGVDVSPESVRAAAEHAVAEGLGIEYAVAPPAELPFDDRTFDAVFCLDLLEQVSDTSAVVAEVARVLQPGGYFFFATVNRTWASRLSLVWWRQRLRGAIPRGLYDWRRFVKPGELQRLLLGHDFMAVDLVGSGTSARPRRGSEPPESSFLTTYQGCCRTPPGPPAV